MVSERLAGARFDACSADTEAAQARGSMPRAASVRQKARGLARPQKATADSKGGWW